MTSVKDIEAEIVGFYKELYTIQENQRFYPSNLHWDPIIENDKKLLEQEFTEDEVHKVVLNLGTNKAHRPDGFTAEFFKKS